MIMVFFIKEINLNQGGKLELHCNYQRLPDQINLLLNILLK